jgi:hypothetical protein
MDTLQVVSRLFSALVSVIITAGIGLVFQFGHLA